MNPSNSFSTKATTGDSKKSIASILFSLDPDDKSEILVYKYRAGAKLLQKTSESDLVKELDAGKYLKISFRLHLICTNNRHHRSQPDALHTCDQEEDPSW